MRFLLIIPFFLLSVSLFSQEGFYQKYTSRDGLPSSQVYHIYQDKQGAMWFATDRGISRFNGSSFENYDQVDGLPSSTVFKFFPQSDGKVWCATIENKWFWFYPERASFHEYRYNDTLVKYANGGLYDDFVILEGAAYFSFEEVPGYIKINSDGNVSRELSDMQISDVHEGVSYIDYDSQKGDFSFWNFSEFKEELFLGTSRLSFKTDKSRFGFRKSSLVNDTCALFSYGRRLEIVSSSSSISVVLESRVLGHGRMSDSSFWVGTLNHGLSIYSLNGELLGRRLESKGVTSYFKDFHGGEWYGTLSDGVYFNSHNDFTFHPIEDNNIYSLAPGKRGVLVSTLSGAIGCLEKGGFYRFPGDGYSGALCGTYNSILGGDVYNALYTKKGDEGTVENQLFLKVDEDSMVFYGGFTYYSEAVNKPLLIVGRWSLFVHDGSRLKKHDLNVPRIKSVAWNNGDVFVGTMNGLFLYDTLSRKSRRIHHALLNTRIEDIKASKNAHFIATMGNGLCRIKDGKFQFVTTQQGLSSDLIVNIWPESDSSVWVGTNKGLNYVVFGKKSVQIELLTISDGLPDDDIADVLVKNGVLWIGTRSGLCSIPVTRVKKMFGEKIHLFLRWSDFEVNGKPRTKKKKRLEFSAGQNNLKFRFDASYFRNPNELIFRYRWNNKKWVYTTDRFILFHELPVGFYSLVIQASKDGKNWKENEINLDFEILPPYYATVWFKTIVVAAIVLIIFLFFRFRVLIYNKHLVREVLRWLIKKLRPKSNVFVVRQNGKDCKINSSDVLYVKSEGNYIQIVTKEKKFFIREKISNFLQLVPDQFEYVRVNRSYIIRIDKVEEHSTKSVTICQEQIPVGVTYQKKISELIHI